MSKAFSLKGVTKNYKDFRLGPIDLELNPGTVLGYVGANGAGKTTTIYVMTGFVVADSGSVEIYGKPNDPNKIDWKYDLGYVGEAGGFYENWKVEKNLKFFSEFYPSWKNEYMLELIKRLDLPLDKKVNALSTGNRMKLKLVCALSYQPKLLLLDEPSSGLDPLIRAEFSDVLHEYMENEERAILYSTHILSDIARLADEFAFVVDGDIISRDNREDLIHDWKSIVCKSSNGLFTIPNVEEMQQENGLYKIISNKSDETLKALRSAGAEIVSDTSLSVNDITLCVLKRAKKK